MSKFYSEMLSRDEKLLVKIMKIGDEWKCSVNPDYGIEDMYLPVKEYPTMEMARWKFAVMISSKCNEIIRVVSSLRDELPSLRELYNEMEEQNK